MRIDRQEITITGMQAGIVVGLGGIPIADQQAVLIGIPFDLVSQCGIVQEAKIVSGFQGGIVAAVLAEFGHVVMAEQFASPSPWSRGNRRRSSRRVLQRHRV